MDRKVKVQDVGTLAAEELLAVVASGACVDPWVQDQLVVFMALAHGTSRVLVGELTSHTRTAVGPQPVDFKHPFQTPVAIKDRIEIPFEFQVPC